MKKHRGGKRAIGSVLPIAGFGQRVSVLLLSLALLGFVFAGTVQANLIAPGGSGLPDNFTGQAGLVLLGTTGLQAFTSTNGLITGTLLAGVFSDPHNFLGAGDLTFLYQVTNSAGSTDAIARVTAISFTGFITDVGFRTDGATIGGPWVNGSSFLFPATVDRGIAGDTVGFTFNQFPFLPIPPGLTSSVLEIQTNAQNFAAGKANLIDGGVATVNAFQPVAVPEPATVLLFGGGLIALAGLRRFRR